MKRKTLMAAVSAVVAALAIAPAAASASAAASTRSGTAPTFAPLADHGGSNWTGYIDLAHRGVKFRKVATRFRVPTVTCTSSNSKASFWVGLDGAGTPTVEQAGISTDCASGRPRYVAWWEMFPHGTQNVFPVHPGDSIIMWVSQNCNCAIYDLSVTDTTAGRSFVQQSLCPPRETCESATAEVILEADNGTNLSRFTTATFTSSTVITRSGASGGFRNTSSWNLRKSLMTGKNGAPLATVSATSRNGEDFSFTYRQRR